MSNSNRKTPTIGITSAPSDKPFKRAEHGRERMAVRAALAHGDDPPHHKMFGDPWDSHKDGKCYIPGRPELLRK